MSHAAAPVRAKASPPAAKLARALRPDIQALRAIAVILVILNHLWPTRMPGGYIGVDVFFVVSGFLISAHLLRELERTGRVRLGTFYARRARRLLPAAYLVTIISIIGVLALMPVSRWREAATEAFAASAYFLNWLLAAKSVDYSASTGAATVVQHYWSLSVEEQFYIVWPVVLIGAFWLATRLRKNARTVLTTVVVSAAVLSFAIAVYSTVTSRNEAYFVTQNRVWEFAIGALVAIAASRLLAHTQHRPILQAVGQWIGILTLAIVPFVFDDKTLFPGPFAALPALATALIIAVGPGIPKYSPFALLRIRPVQFTGDISYSLYLWHWPLIVLAPFALARDLRFADRIVLIVLSFALAAATKYLVEDTTRQKLLAGASLPKFFSLLAASIAVLFACSAAIVGVVDARAAADAERTEELESSECFGAQSLAPGADCGDPFAAIAELPVAENQTPWFVEDACTAVPGVIAVGDEQLYQRCDFSDGDPQAPEVWLVGDSHAEHWQAAMFEIARAEGWQVNLSLLGGCPLVDVPRVSFMDGAPDTQETQQRCLDWSSKLSEVIAKRSPAPDLVIASSFAAAEKIDDGSGRPQDEQYFDAATRLFSQWSESGTKIAVIRDAPIARETATPDCLAKHMDDPMACAAPRAEALANDPFAAAARSDGNVSVIDLTDRFCTDSVCFALAGSVPVYFDGNHLSRSYSLSLATPLRDQLLPLLPQR
ncbi:acyltransferase family protein [Leucobacter sp. BZR 635]